MGQRQTDREMRGVLGDRTVGVGAYLLLPPIGCGQSTGNGQELAAGAGQEGWGQEWGTLYFSALRGSCGVAALGRAPAPIPSKGPTQANETKVSRDSLSIPVLSGGHPVLPPLPRGICQCLETGRVVTIREGGATGI